MTWSPGPTPRDTRRRRVDDADDLQARRVRERVGAHDRPLAAADLDVGAVDGGVQRADADLVGRPAAGAAPRARRAPPGRRSGRSRSRARSPRGRRHEHGLRRDVDRRPRVEARAGARPAVVDARVEQQLEALPARSPARRTTSAQRRVQHHEHVVVGLVGAVAREQVAR